MSGAQTAADAEMEYWSLKVTRDKAHALAVKNPEDPYWGDEYRRAARLCSRAYRRCLEIAAADKPRCHCGKPVAFGFDGDPYHHRGMCIDCDAVRCDAYPGECGR